MESSGSSCLVFLSTGPYALLWPSQELSPPPGVPGPSGRRFSPSMSLHGSHVSCPNTNSYPTFFF